MKYKFIELRDTNISLFLANSYHDDPDTCVYLMALRGKTLLFPTGYRYHYKIYKLHNNQLEGPEFFKVDNSLVFEMSQPAKEYIAKIIDSTIERSKHATSCLEHAKTCYDGDFSSAQQLVRNPALGGAIADLNDSGAVSMRQDNSYEEISSPTKLTRAASDALTYFYCAMRKRGDDYHYLATSDDEKKQQPKIRNPIPLQDDDKSIALSGREVIFSDARQKIRNPAFKRLDFAPKPKI